MNDKDYATPQDHYFSYINQRKDGDDKLREKEVLQSLGMEAFISPEYKPKILEDTEKNMNGNQVYLDENNQAIKPEDMDIFELARHKGTRIAELDELKSDEELDYLRRAENRGQKHSKREYEQLKNLSIIDILKMSETTRVQKKYTDDLIQGFEG